MAREVKNTTKKYQNKSTKKATIKKDTKKRNSSRKNGKKCLKNNKNTIKTNIFRLFLLFFTILVLYLLYCYYTLPDIQKAISQTRQPTTVITADNGNEIQTFGNIYQQVMTPDDLPHHMIEAIISTEDRRFFSHFGFDVVAFTRAIVRNLMAGRYAEGGSTITQQVAKNLFLTPNKTIKRKVQELMLSFWLESKFSKEQILTLYLNRVYLGSSTFGVQAASQKYFQKPATDLNLKEAAIIAGLLKAPSRLNPIANRELAEKRAIEVLQNMVDNNMLEKSEFEKAKKMAIGSSETSKVKGGKHFAEWLYLEVNATIGERDSDTIVYSTLDQKMQENAETILEEAISRNKNKNVSQGAIIVIENTGAIRAMVGGIDYNKSQFNRATQANRQAGSTFKTFVYLTALEQGFKPKDKIKDEPITIGTWKPTNISGTYQGKVTLDQAFSQSLNLATVRLAEKVGYTDIARTAQKLGISSSLPRIPSMALGSVQVSVLDMAVAYASIANGGYKVYPYGINEIYQKDGHQLYFKDETDLNQVIESKPAKEILEMLENVIKNGTGKKANTGSYMGGKTGTSNDFRDAWFVGFTKEHTIAVWLGNDDNSPMKSITGGNLPAEIFRKVALSI